jgi:hypothetical protein
MVKLDWQINDSNTLEYTRIDDKTEDTRKYFGFNYATLERTNVQKGGVSYVNWGPTPVASQQGAKVDILKYTGYVTDSLTVTALVGKTYTAHAQSPDGYDPTLPQVGFTNGQAPGLTYTAPQGTTGNLLTPGAFDENKGGRFDIEWKVNEQHKLRAGIDANVINSLAGTSTAGGVVWTYLKATNPNDPVYPGAKGPGSVAGNAIAQQGYYVESSRFSAASTPRVKQQAAYVEDQWQVNKDVLMILGLRNEAFDNQNGDKLSYIKLNKQIAPRFSVIWDRNSDATQVFKASAGRYHVPLPTNVAVRGAGLVVQRPHGVCLYRYRPEDRRTDRDDGAGPALFVEQRIRSGQRSENGGCLEHEGQLSRRVHRRHGAATRRRLEGQREANLSLAQNGDRRSL